MNRSLAFLVGILALIAACVWFFTSGNPSSLMQADVDTSSSTTPPAAAVTTTTPTSSGQKVPSKGVPNASTYKSLLTQTGSYECDYNSADARGRTTNVVYIYGGKMRGEFRTIESGESTSSLFVYDGRYLYLWKEGASVGKRTLLTSLSQLPFILPKDLTSGSIIGDNYASVGWLCHVWLTNKSLLMPPSYVTYR